MERAESPDEGYILAGRNGQPVILDNLAKRKIRPRLELANRLAAEKGEEVRLVWPGWYSLRRFLGTEVCMHSDSETASKALGNTKPVAEKHYIKPQTAHPAVRRAMNEAASGLVN